MKENETPPTQQLPSEEQKKEVMDCMELLHEVLVENNIRMGVEISAMVNLIGVALKQIDPLHIKNRAIDSIIEELQKCRG